MQAGRVKSDFVHRLGEALAEAGRRGVRVSAGSGPCDLEMQELAVRESDGSYSDGTGPQHLEGPPRALYPGAADGRGTKLCYFLDGVQSTREIGRVGAVPVVVTTVAAAVVNRCERRFKRVNLEGPPVVVRAVILPLRANDPGVETLRDLLLDAGFEPLGHDAPPEAPDLVLDSTEYIGDPDPTDYVAMKGWAFGRARSLRERLEAQLLQRWAGDDRVLDSDDWIAVDGQLRMRVGELPPDRMVGLIKSVLKPEFVSDDVNVLLDLEPGMRTTSFVPGWQRKLSPGEQRTSWYLRVWPPQPGADALGSLMRVEAPLGTGPEKVDEITRWVLAEKAPLAKPDPRWPAMIYPISHVEKILKPMVAGSERSYAHLARRLAPANGRS
jgi:hypothetical protein